MISDLRWDSFQKYLHLCRDCIHTVHDPGVHDISGNDLLSWKAGNTVDPDHLAGILSLIVQSSHGNLKPLTGTCANLQIITLTYLCTDSFIHLSARRLYFPH